MVIMVNINIDTGLDLLFIKNSTTTRWGPVTLYCNLPTYRRLVFPERELPVDKNF